MVPLSKTGHQCSTTSQLFDFSLRERAYLLRAVFCGQLSHLSHVNIPPRALVSRIQAEHLLFLWKQRTELVCRPALCLPKCYGGFSTPDGGLMCRGMALKTACQILRADASPTQVLPKYWMGVRSFKIATAS